MKQKQREFRKTLIGAGIAAALAGLAAQATEPKLFVVTNEDAAWSNVVHDGSGNFLVSWQGGTSCCTWESRAFDHNALVTGVETPLGVGNPFYTPAVAMNHTGQYVTVQYQPNATPHTGGVLQAQRHNADGSLNGAAITVGTATENFGPTPMVAMDDDGDFAVAWSVTKAKVIKEFSYGYAALESRTSATHLKVYGPTGAPRTPLLTVASLPPAVVYTKIGTGYEEALLGLAMNGSGQIVVTVGQDTTVGFGAAAAQSRQILARQYSLTGTAGPAINVGPVLDTALPPTGGPVGIDASGNFVVESAQTDGTTVMARYAADGSFLGNTLPLSIGGYNDQPPLTVAPNGDFAIAWEGYPVLNLNVQFFHADGTPNGATVSFNDDVFDKGYLSTTMGNDDVLDLVWTIYNNGTGVYGAQVTPN